MSALARTVLCLAVLVVSAPSLRANAVEDRAFDNAAKSFRGGWWERAEKEFAEFVEKFPKSDRRLEAILQQARARLKQSNPAGAAELLSANLSDAGKLGHEFQFWLAEAHFQNSNFVAAAQAYATVATQFTNSPHLLEASYSEALARSRMNDWDSVINLLTQPGAFQSAARKNPTNDSVFYGQLLLAETRLKKGSCKDAERGLVELGSFPLKHDQQCHRLSLLLRVQLADSRPLDALETATNLVECARALGKPDFLADSISSEANLLAQLGRLDEAVSLYEKNLAADWPIGQRRHALLQMIELTLAQHKTDEAVQKLENFLKQNPNDPAADAAILTIGELCLKDHVSSSAAKAAATNIAGAQAETNLLLKAQARFDQLITLYTNSEYLPKAHLDRGWCLWLAGKTAESFENFSFAAVGLPVSADQAIARFKVADCQFALGDPAGALTNYSIIVTGYPSIRFVQDELVETALYQTVRAALKARDQAAAANALKRILSDYPNSFVCDRSILLVGQNLAREGKSAQARNLFESFANTNSNSDLLPDIYLAIARTYEHDANWGDAIRTYTICLTNWPSNPAHAAAEFGRAWANYQAGNETNAFVLFTNFVASFPTNQLAPQAQNWIGDYFFRHGDFQNAELNYKLLFQNPPWQKSALARSAMMMAGRAAMARESREDLAVAADYFTAVINDLDCPPDMLGEAFFALGDTFMKRGDFEEALARFDKIRSNLKTNAIVPLAQGRIGDCYFQLAAQKPEYYSNALHSYEQVVASHLARASARSEAEVKLAIVLEKLAETAPRPDQTNLANAALDRYLNVFYEKNLRAGEKPDWFWCQKAHRQVLELYKRYADVLPRKPDDFDTQTGKFTAK